MDTGFFVAGDNVYSGNDFPRYHLRSGHIVSLRGDTGYRIEGNRIVTDKGDSGYYLENGRIYGPSKDLPWAQHKRGEVPIGPGY